VRWTRRPGPSSRNDPTIVPPPSAPPQFRP
jgi:hypothetical protein